MSHSLNDSVGTERLLFLGGMKKTAWGWNRSTMQDKKNGGGALSEEVMYQKGSGILMVIFALKISY